jgi:hypothetical protein
MCGAFLYLRIISGQATELSGNNLLSGKAIMLDTQYPIIQKCLIAIHFFVIAGYCLVLSSFKAKNIFKACKLDTGYPILLIFLRTFVGKSFNL